MMYEKIIVRRGKKVEAVREGLKAMTLTRYFCKVFFFLEKPEFLDCRRMENLIKWKEIDNSKITPFHKGFTPTLLS